MKISDEGLRLIKSFEGYHTRQADGSCKAYLCPAKVWTCGWGATEGVTPHTHWSEAEAEQRLQHELQKFEAAVLRHVKVALNQNEFDALVSFAYNCGEGALKKSTLLKRLNAERRTDAAREFLKWTRGGGRVLKGLVARRARESALFLKPVEMPTEPYMPQAVKPPLPMPPPVVTVPTACVATASALPFIPAPPVDIVANVAGWQTAAETMVNFVSSPVLLWAVGGMLIYWVAAPKLARYLT